MAKSDTRLSFTQNFISGGIAGVFSRTFTSPLDVVKILAQVGTADTKQGFLKSFSNIYQKEGLKAFWKGNGVACVRLFPYNAVQFATFHQLKKSLSDANGKLGALAAAFSGSMGGIAASVSTYPLDMVKTRLTIQKEHGGAKVYEGIVDCMVKVARQEGVGALYKGLLTTVIGVVPFAGGTFMAYEVLNPIWGKAQLSPIESFINGCLAAAFAQTFSYPFDLIRKKLQAQGIEKTGKAGDMGVGELRYNGMMDAFAKVYKAEGIAGWFRGTTANLAKVAPYAGLMFVAFEASSRVFLYMNGYRDSPW